MIYRQSLDRQLRLLRDEILLLGSMVESANLSAMDAFNQRDETLARQVLLGDALINEKRFAIENAIIITMATQQPTARDLRRLVALLEIGTELERMGDYAKGIGKAVLRMGEDDFSIPTRELNEMAALGLKMLHRSLTAFFDEDTALASQIPVEDDLVDHLYGQVYRHIVSAMIRDPERIDQANSLLWVAHNLERLADRAKNICERTIFVASGDLLEFEHDDDFELNE